VKKLRTLALVHDHLVPPEDTTGVDVLEADWKMEYDVIETLKENGHDVRVLGIHDDLIGIRQAVEEFKPQIVFNLMEAFAGVTTFDQNVVSYLELLRLPYTGCNPRGLILARGKDLSKTLVHYHRIPVPAFAVFPLNRKVKRPSRLALPLIVKSLSEDGSVGISQASIVDTDEQLAERVAFVHERLETAAIAEQYIEGRELYVAVLGNNRLQVLPVWELKFGSMGGQGARQIATKKAKHDPDYQERVGIVDGPADDLAPEVYARIQRTAKRIYKILGLDGYARIDFRLAPDGTPYFIEANPNPEIAKSQEFATAAKHDGLDYPDLLQRILALGISRAKAGASVG
jgi:D-alanine-D-alanine ligase